MSDEIDTKKTTSFASDHQVLIIKFIRRVFFLVLVVGVLLIVGLNPIPQFERFIPNSNIDRGLKSFISIILCLFVMLLYYLYGREKQKSLKGLSNKRFADSLYYLGFLFTLCSLLAAFLSISNIPAENVSDKMPHLIGMSGVALVTTIFGLSLKIFHSQFDLSSQGHFEGLDRSVDKAAESLLEFAGSTSKAGNELRQEATKTTEIFNTAANDTTTKFDKAVDDTNDNLKKNIDEVTKSFAASAESTSEYAKARINEVHIQAIAAVEHAGNTIRDGAKNAADEIELASGKGAKLVSGEFSRVTGLVGKLMGDVAELLENVVVQIAASSDAATQNIAASSDAATQNIAAGSDAATQNFAAGSDAATRDITEAVISNTRDIVVATGSAANEVKRISDEHTVEIKSQFDDIQDKQKKQGKKSPALSPIWTI